MGLREWLTGRGTQKTSGSEVEVAPKTAGDSRETPPFRIEIQLDSPGPLIELTGLTTFGAQGVEGLVRRRSLADRAELVTEAVLQREPTNPADPEAIEVLVEGERVGYLPSFATGVANLTVGGARSVRLQLFTVHDGKRRWTRGWVWLAGDEPKWEHGPGDVPPLTSAEKRVAAARGTQRMVDEALDNGGSRADQFAAGMVEGRHYLELVEPIKELKRQGRLEEALQLCYRAIEGAERDLQGGRPAPWYTEQAAITHRKLKQPDAEVAVLRRYLRHVPETEWDGTSIGQRLRKLQPN